MKMRFAPLLVLLAIAPLAVRSQAPTAQGPAPRVAIIDSDVFGDEKGGITQLINALKAVQAQFKPQKDELTNLNNQLNAIAKEVQAMQAAPNADPVAYQKKVDEGQRLQVEIKRKGEDAQSGFEKALQDRADPINKDVSIALQAYAKKRGIDILIDASKFPGGIFAINATSDITDDFIKDYNSRNAGVPVK